MACRFLTPKEFMVAVHLSRATVYKGVRDGSIPSVRISKRKILIPEDALERGLSPAVYSLQRARYERLLDRIGRRQHTQGVDD
jgi:excisionase family DNA binding protein